MSIRRDDGREALINLYDERNTPAVAGFFLFGGASQGSYSIRRDKSSLRMTGELRGKGALDTTSLATCEQVLAEVMMLADEEEIAGNI